MTPITFNTIPTIAEIDDYFDKYLVKPNIPMPSVIIKLEDESFVFDFTINKLQNDVRMNVSKYNQEKDDFTGEELAISHYKDDDTNEALFWRDDKLVDKTTNITDLKFYVNLIRLEYPKAITEFIPKCYYEFLNYLGYQLML